VKLIVGERAEKPDCGIARSPGGSLIVVVLQEARPGGGKCVTREPLSGPCTNTSILY